MKASSRVRRFVWIKTLKQGDIIKSPRGRLRVIRYVTHRGDSLGKTCVGMTIQHPSWTTRPYTIMTGSDLATLGYSKVRGTLRLNSEFDQLVEEDFSAVRAEFCNFRSSDVQGIG